MKIYFVSQGKTAKHEIDGKYLWSPLKNKSGGEVPAYVLMRGVKNGDVVFHYSKGALRAISRAVTDAYDAPKPTEFGTSGDDWSNNGTRVDLDLFELKKESELSEWNSEVVKVQPKGPLNVHGGVNQQYLCELNKDAAAKILRAVVNHEENETFTSFFKECALDMAIDENECGMGKNMFYQKIFFGAPGTGKSHKVNLITPKDNTITFRTTFHPDYDYVQFVGSYKPKKEGSSITYSFVPQVFAKAYAAAWKNLNQPVYLVIEEINRGNCAQIFGDIFQLLDRKDGHSEYPIDVDSDFANFIRAELADKFSDYKKEICSYCEDAADESQTADDEFCKIALPPNFNILATMNTSDQSLFPMDSAFKRRFDWEYVPIDYKKTEADFTIVIGDKKYRWLDFLKKVNADIYIATESEDKQMGEFFVKPSDGKTIDLPTFCSKVLFYLWDSVYKDDDQNKKVFRFDWKFDGEEKNRPVTFQSLFEDEKTKIAIVQKMMENLDVPEKQ